LPETVCICENPRGLAHRAAWHIADAATAAVSRRGRFSLCLSGGDTPGETYSVLGSELRESVPWSAVHVFWGDERCIPLDRPDNHFTMASASLLSHVPIPPENIHRARGEATDPAAAALEYEAMLRDYFGHPDGFPTFDLVLLGMGEDGHVASLFPGSDGWAERERWVVDHHVVKRGERVRRLTLTMPVLTAARQVMLLVSGELKATMLDEVLNGAADVPASELNRSAADVCWMVDADAAAALAPVSAGQGAARR
jgi:6-phosphogluconolactonase